jgi:capsular polysaccharide biosynthesis protein
MPTAYTDTFKGLNPHLHTGPPSAPPRLATYQCLRHPPTIVSDAAEIRSRLQRVFHFHDCLFDAPHSVVYPYMTSRETSPTWLRRGAILNVNYRWGTEYFHFLTEVLPSVLFVAERYPGARIYVEESRFTKPVFHWFGIHAPLSPRLPLTSVRIQCPYVECGNPSPEKIRLLRAVIESKLSFSRTHGVLIRREHSRAINNEPEVLAALQRRHPDLTWVIYDHLPPDETAVLFSKAAVIAGPHGAGLTNMIFSGPGATVLEFMPLSEPNLCYWHLSELLGHRYTMIPAPASSPALSMTCRLPSLG